MLETLLARLPPAVIVIRDEDVHDPNPWRNYQRCLSDLPGDATHVLVIQDDALPCPHFAEVVERVIAHRQNDIISLFVGGLPGRTRRDFLVALGSGSSWVPIYFREIHHVVALVWPVAYAADFLEWAQTAKLPGHRGHPRSDDAIVGYWARKCRHIFWATVPNLVEHEDIVSSTIRRAAAPTGTGRKAIRFVEGDPREIDWSWQ